MIGKNSKHLKKTGQRREKILLALMPFWDPQIPPLGISCLKSYLQQYQFQVKTVDLNIRDSFRDIQNQYFETLKQYIPPDKWGNYYKITHDVLQNHAMAYFMHTNEERYLELVKLLVYKTFYITLEDRQIQNLCEILPVFFDRLKRVLLGLLEKEEPTILGLSVFGDTLPASLFAFKLTRENFPYIKTVMGGAIFSDQLNMNSPDFGYFLHQTPYIDKIIVGEGERLFLKYLLNQLPDRPRVYTLKNTGSQPLDLSLVDVPDFSDLDLQFYPYLSAFTSRSCAYQCRFCSEKTLWGKFRKKAPEQVVDELTRLHRKHRSQLFMFGDSLINPVIDDLAAEFVKSGASLYWDGYFRVDREACDIEKTLLWRQAGFYRARLGVESGSPRVLDLMHKHINLPRIKQTLSALAYAGIKTTTYWVIGFPGETEADFLKTLKLIEELKDDIYEADCTPFRYYLSGQPGSSQWARQNKAIPLYGQETRNLLMVQTRIMDSKPFREETYKRMWRFTQHCTKLGIPNPYSLKEFHKADERWKKKQKNAVPPQVDFSTGIVLRENREYKPLTAAKKKTRQLKEADFGF
jgi:radical SAM superfamily enzyme YgiQ (UPF0313 family)